MILFGQIIAPIGFIVWILLGVRTARDLRSQFGGIPSKGVHR
jgi:hypothetical protein